MLAVHSLRVRSFCLDYLDVFWAVDPTYSDVHDFTFVVEKSFAEFGPYFDLTGEFTDKYQVRDNTVRGQHSFYTSHFYRIRVKEIETGAMSVFPASGAGVRLAADPDLYALEMARIERLRLKEFDGRKVWVFPRKQFGQRCSCYDEVMQRKMRSDCLSCFDTGWVGGYNTPLETYAQIRSPDEQTQKSSIGEIEVENGSGRFSNFPALHEGWVIVEAENVRWRVGSRINTVEKSRSLIRQVAPLHRIPSGDIEYSLPLNIDEPGSILATAIRNYTGATNLESSLAGILLNQNVPTSVLNSFTAGAGGFSASAFGSVGGTQALAAGRGFTFLSSTALVAPISPPSGSSDGGPNTFTMYLVNADALLSGDPTENEETASNTAANNLAFTIMHIMEVDIPDPTDIVDIFAALRWSSEVTAGASQGRTKFMISVVPEASGGPPSASAIDISDEIIATTSKVVHELSGLITSIAIPAGPFRILLLGKTGAASEEVTATLFDESSLEITVGS